MNNEDKEILKEEEVQVLDSPQKETVQNVVESKNNNKNNKNKKVLIIIISLLVVLLIAGGISIYFVNKNLSDSKTDDDIVEKENDKGHSQVEENDDKDSSTKEENDDKTNNTSEENDSSKISGVKYSISGFDTSRYEFNTMKNTSTLDSIVTYDVYSSTDVTYTFEINNGSVNVSNSLTNSQYTIKSIKNAKQLIVADIGQSPEYTAAFIITTDGKLYSISLFSSSFRLITDCSQFENTVESYSFDSEIMSISFGSYKSSGSSGGEGAILITDNNSKQYVLLS